LHITLLPPHLIFYLHILFTDSSSSLILVGESKNETSPCNLTSFNATILWEKSILKGNETIRIFPACNSSQKLINLRQAFQSSNLANYVNVSSIGISGSFALTFDSAYSYIAIKVDNTTENLDNLRRLGLSNGDFEKKALFQFSVGHLEVLAEAEVKGSAEVTASVADVLEVEADLDANLFGNVQFSAGKMGQLVPFDDWLATLVAVKDNSSEFYSENFTVAALTFDGAITGTVSANVGALKLPSASVTGKFREPYKLDLLRLNGNTTRPNFVMDVNVPNFGDIRNLSFSDVVNLLKQALVMLVGSEDGDTVESCSGGLLGGEVFTMKIPVVGVSACNFAGVLQILVDTVDKLSSECSSCTNNTDSSGTDPTFQALEVKLQNLLQGMIFFLFVHYEPHFC